MAPAFNSNHAGDNTALEFEFILHLDGIKLGAR
jgi:hypothetical protein